jgi:hypothetical protein
VDQVVEVRSLQEEQPQHRHLLLLWGQQVTAMQVAVVLQVQVMVLVVAVVPAQLVNLGLQPMAEMVALVDQLVLLE